MADQKKPQENIKKIKIVNCTLGYAGKNQRGDDYSIFEVEAENGEGQLIKEPLRSFSPLPIGQVIEVTVKRFDSTKHGVSYTLTPKRGAGGPHAQAINEMQEAIADLQRRVQALEAFGQPAR
jgi:hypothetical protein